VTENAAQSPSRSNADVVQQALNERVKELQAFYGLCEVVEREDVSLEEIYQALVAILPKSWQYDEIACARIVVGDLEFITENFAESPWAQSAPVKVKGVVIGAIDVGYLEERPEQDEGPFSRDERRLIDALAKRLGQIIDRKRAEEALKESEERYRQIYQLSPDAVLIHNMNMNILDANDKAVEQFGYSKKELLGMKISELHPETELEHSTQVLADMKQHNILYVETSFVRKDGSVFPAEATPCKYALGGKLIIHAVIRDITKRVRAEKEKLAMEASLRQSQKLESVGTLAAGVAHEINNPLMGMINYADLIAEKVKDDTLKEYSQVIMREGNRIATIVRNLLSFSRQNKGTYSPADIREIIDRSLSLVGSTLRKDQITVELDIPEDLPQVKCRSQHIQQVIMNLLTNAHDALNVRYPDYDEDKIIRITSRLFEEDGEDWIKTTVEDHGIGISEDVMQRIFDPFFTTKPRNEGTGLGLSVSFGIVTEHHGELTVESAPGEYTRFHMDLRINNGWSHNKNQEDAAELGKMGE